MIIKHMKSDPNAVKHAALGASSSVLVSAISLYIDLPYWLLLSLVSAFVMGISIEVIQHIYRSATGGNQNTLKENYLDIMQTGLWYITFFVNYRK